jgi:hypothetical protein
MSCVHCNELGTKFDINRPSDLRKVILIVQSKLADGTLHEIQSNSQEAFNVAVGGEGWPDILDFAFQCQHCHQGFKLIAETYHGSGGSWSPSA